MKFTHYNLGYQQRGTAVEVTLQGSAANVQLLDSLNFQNYKSGRQYKYSGGARPSLAYSIGGTRAMGTGT